MSLQAFLEMPGPEGRMVHLPARTVDLSTAGAGLIIRRPLDYDNVMAVVVEDMADTHRRQRRWRGRVVYHQEVDAGRRLGISFDTPDDGPSVTFRMRVAGRGERRVRLDRPMGLVDAETGLPPATEDKPGTSVASRPGLALLRGGALIGLTLDQLIKAFLVGMPAGSGVMTTATPSLAELTPTLLGLGTAGMIARLVEQGDGALRPAVSTGMGLVLGGLLSMLVDRAVMGGPRVPDGWPLTPADVLAATGAAVTLLALLGAQGKEVLLRRGVAAVREARSVPNGAT
jgi:hypothetical protein